MRRFASQRTKPHVQTAVLALIALTVVFTLSSVRHLAGAIATRHSLSRSDSKFDSHKLLESDDELTRKGLPHWWHDGSVQRATSSVRGNTPDLKGALQITSSRNQLLFAEAMVAQEQCCPQLAMWATAGQQYLQVHLKWKAFLPQTSKLKPSCPAYPPVPTATP